MYTSVSSDFLEVLARPSRHFAARFKYNGTEVPLEVKTIKHTVGTCGGSQLAVGCAYAGYIEVTAKYTDLLLEGKELFLEIGLLMDDDSYEYVPFGYWTVQKPKKSNDTLTFQAVDRMAGMLYTDYETELTYPATAAAVLSEFATKTGLTVTCSLQTSSVTFPVKIEGVTNRGALAVIAATLLGNAWIDRTGNVVISAIGGGTFVQVNYDYVKGQPEMDEEATEITGVKVYTVAGQTDTYIERGSGNMVTVSDVYMTDNNLDAVKNNVIGITYGGGSVSFMGNPLLDPDDVVFFRGGADSDMLEYMLVTENDEEIADDEDVSFVGLDYTSFNVPCMEIVQSFDGGLLTTISAPGQFETTENTVSVGAVTEELRRQAKEIAQTESTLSTVSQTANNAMTTANGKNKIFYQNSAPTTGMSEGDLWFDTDGGNAIYEYKKTGSNPDTYEWTLRQLGQGSIAAGSITANEINVNNLAAISANLGNVVIGGSGNADGKITVKNASNVTVGTWDNSGIDAQGKFKATNGNETCVLDSDALGAYVSAANSVTSIRISANNDGSVGLYEVTPVAGGGDTVETILERTGLAVNVGFPLTVGYFPLTPNVGVTIGTDGNISATGTGYIKSSITSDAGIIIRNTGLTKGTNPSSETSKYFVFTDKDGFTSSQNDVIGSIYSGVGSTGLVYTLMRAYKNNTSAATYAQLSVFYPASGSPYVEISDGCYLNVKNADILSTVANGEAHVTARNSSTGNRIMLWANSTNGRCGIYSCDSNNTARSILARENNSGAVTAYGSWTFDNTITGTITPPSDVRLKTNIKDCTIDALSLINAIRMREFDWNDGRHQYIGVIADELEELDYRLAIGGGYDNNGKMVIKGVDEFYLMGYLIKAVQELSAEVNRLKGVA